MLSPTSRGRWSSAAERPGGPASRPCNKISAVVYCVIPEGLEEELFDKLTRYYADDPEVTVIVDRRKRSRRGRGSSGGGKRQLRDRRRPRVPGELPQLSGD